MRHIIGIYNGMTVEFPEPLDLLPGTAVEVVVPEPTVPNDVELLDDDAVDRAVLAALYERGMVASPKPPTGAIDLDWQPIPNPGDPISEDILADRG
ncbi:MAG: hypothetical protein H0X37_23605 [Herpetosiphonaceae bacterium]|nr:hypothetical protein [Herpetosiphonaceae bacterium]